MKWLLLLGVVSILLVAGCSGNNLTGNTTLDAGSYTQLMSDCVTACAKCNPQVLTEGCEQQCTEIYHNGGLYKLEKYAELYSNKC